MRLNQGVSASRKNSPVFKCINISHFLLQRHHYPAKSNERRQYALRAAPVHAAYLSMLVERNSTHVPRRLLWEASPLNVLKPTRLGFMRQFPCRSYASWHQSGFEEQTAKKDGGLEDDSRDCEAAYVCCLDYT